MWMAEEAVENVGKSPREGFEIRRGRISHRPDQGMRRGGTGFPRSMQQRRERFPGLMARIGVTHDA